MPNNTPFAGRAGALPIDSLRPEFMAALEVGHVVVEAPTASGKSTRLPVWCAERGRVLVVEPRRLACRALARYVADDQGTGLGQGVGYAVRFDSRHGPDSQVVFITPGVALRWLAEHGLGAFGTVVLDEFHERRWDTDLLAALLRRRGQHRLVVASATVAGERLARYLNGRCLNAPGHPHPLELRHTEERELPRLRGLDERVCSAVRDVLQHTGEGDVLVFLPGRSEIQSVRHALGGHLDAEVIPLHAGVEAAIQDVRLRADGRAGVAVFGSGHADLPSTDRRGREGA